MTVTNSKLKLNETALMWASQRSNTGRLGASYANEDVEQVSKVPEAESGIMTVEVSYRRRLIAPRRVSAQAKPRLTALNAVIVDEHQAW